MIQPPPTPTTHPTHTEAVADATASGFKGANVNNDELLPRFIRAAQTHDGHLGSKAIKSLMAEAWEEGKDAGLNGGWDNPYLEES